MTKDEERVFYDSTADDLASDANAADRTQLTQLALHVPLECPDTRSLFPVRRVSRCSFVSAAMASAKSYLRIKDQVISHRGRVFLLHRGFLLRVSSLDVTGSDR
jgi:hypothetical protein